MQENLYCNKLYKNSGCQDHRKCSFYWVMSLSCVRLWKLWSQFIFFLSFKSFHVSAVMPFESKTFDYHLCFSLKLNEELCGRLAGLQNELFWHWQNVTATENLQVLCSVVVKVEFSARFGRFQSFLLHQTISSLSSPNHLLSAPTRQPHWSDCFPCFVFVFVFFW